MGSTSARDWPACRADSSRAVNRPARRRSPLADAIGQFGGAAAELDGGVDDQAPEGPIVGASGSRVTSSVTRWPPSSKVSKKSSSREGS
jgi:hypothetical protein